MKIDVGGSRFPLTQKCNVIGNVLVGEAGVIRKPGEGSNPREDGISL